MTAPRPKGTKRADRRALVDAGKRLRAIELDHGYTAGATFPSDELTLRDAQYTALYLLKCYAVGRRRASVEFGHKVYKKSQRTQTTREE